MAWQEDMTEVLRVLADDMGETPTYSDDKLERVLVVAAFQVLREVKVHYDYSASLANTTITPDPTASASKDESFVNLVTLKAACVIDRGTAVTAAQRAISVRDGGSSVDLRGVFGAKLQLLEKGWCAVYEDAKLEYLTGQARIAGAAILTPFRLYSDSAGWGSTGYLGSRDREVY